jgi:GH25 family lysozyme M1 (1,4-beta-N-acetylmuramidase)
VTRNLAAVRRSARSLVVLLTAASAVTASALAYADGIDISHHQGTVSWSRVSSSGVTFAFMKATEGSTYADPTLRTNWAGAEQQGIYRSAYHFARPTTGSAVSQAKYFVSKAGTFSDKGDLPPVLDLEASGTLGTTALRSWVSDWLTTVERLTGRTPIIYVSPGFWEGHMGNSTAFHHYPLWVAHYGVSAPRVPGGWSTWTFWQRTSTGRVSGIAGNVDMNKFNGSATQLAKLANTSDSSKGPVQPGPTVPPVAATMLTLTPAKTAAAIDETVRFAGTLRTMAAVLPRHKVSVWRRALGSSTWAKVGEDATGRRGRYFVSAKVATSGDYQARFALTKTYALSVSPVVRVTTPPPAAVSLDLRKRAGTVTKGSALKLYGYLKAGSLGVPDEVVRYYKRTAGHTQWIYVGSSTTLASGRHALVVHPKISRIWKVVFAGENRYAPQKSTNLSVHVR